MPYKNLLNLQLFAEDGGADMAGTGELATPATENPVSDGVATGGTGEQVVTAPQDGQPQEETFESLIAGKYKKEYEQSIKSAMQKRFKNQRDLQSKVDRIDPIVRTMAERYNIKPAADGSISIDDLHNAIMNDNAAYEQEAFQRGMNVEDLKQLKRLEAENASLRMQNARTAEQREWDALVAQGEQVREMYPEFDLDAEMQNPQFGRLLATMQKSGFPNAVRTAYEAVHREEIMGGAMRYAVQQTEQKISKSIQSGMRRPAENGTTQQAAASVGTTDPSKLTRAQIEDIKKRAERGEKITF